MSGIDKYLEVIKNGVFGREVRQAIHDGIQQAYDDATANGNANMEVAKARGYANTLVERLDQMEIADKSTAQDISVVSGRIDNLIANAGNGTVPSELTDMRVAFDGKKYSTAGEAVREQFTVLENIVTSLSIVNVINIFDKGDVTQGKYIKPNDGNLGTVSDWYASGFIDVSKYKNIYVVSREAGDASHYAFYTDRKTYISGGSVNTQQNKSFLDSKLEIPENAKYLRISMIKINKFMIVPENMYKVDMPFSAYGELSLIHDKVPEISQLLKNEVILEVGPGKQFVRLNQAIDYANSLNGKKIIKIYEGVYNVFDAMEPVLGYIGLDVSDIEIVGVGKKENIVIHGELPESIDWNIRDKISVFNIKGNFKAKNLTISARNIRYTIHDDYPVVSYCTVDYEDCVLKGERMAHHNVYGCGLWNGTTYNFKRVDFVATGTTFCYGFHKIANQDKAVTPANINFNNCNFITDNTYFCTFNSDHNKYDDYLTFNNCTFGGFISPTGENCAVKISGGGNSPLILRDRTVNKNCLIEFSDTTLKLKNVSESLLTKGTIVKRDGFSGMRTCLNSDTPVGVCLHDIPPGEFGTIQFKGQLPNTIVTGAIGTVISNDNGVIVKNDSNPIGKITYTDSALVNI